MKFTETNLKGCFLIELDIHQDNRGWFARTYCEDEFASAGLKGIWKQINHSVTLKKGTVRGMHYQLPPFQEIKLVRCISGCINDVVVDIRKNSPTFLKYIQIELSAVNRKMIYIPVGMAHGFQTVTDNVELIYHHSGVYSPQHEGGCNYADKTLNIDWKLPVELVSDKDRALPMITPDFRGI